MVAESSISELRASVKRWEREFESSHGRKPTQADAKANSTVWSLYQSYKAVKRTSANQHGDRAASGTNSVSNSVTNRKEEQPHTPKKKPYKQSKVAAAGTKSEDQIEASDTEEDEDGDETSLLQNVSEVFPTPQFLGKVLGLFDVELKAPQTPQKSTLNHGNGGLQSPLTSSSSPYPQSPLRAPSVIETPQSKRTPDYFHYRVNLFPAGNNNNNNGQNSTNSMLAPPGESSTEPMESPLIKRRQSRTKSVTDIMREASEITASQNAGIFADNEDGSSSSGEEDINYSELPALKMSTEPGILDTVPIMHENADAKGRRKGPKRQTRRVVMRPVDHNSSALSTAKATDNFVRLKINNKNKRPMRRR